MQLAKLCSTSASITPNLVGAAANNMALTATATPAAPAATRLSRSLSTTAPPGIWLSMAAAVPRLSTSPISTCVHASVVRYTAIKGPKPV